VSIFFIVLFLQLTSVFIHSLLHYRRVLEKYPLLAYRRFWWKKQPDSRYQLLEPMVENKLVLDYLPEKCVLRNFLFTAMV